MILSFIREANKKLIEKEATKEEKEIAYKQQLTFHKEHPKIETRLIQYAIFKAEFTKEYKEYAKIEHNYLALNKFRLFVADDLLKVNAPKMKTRRLTAPPPSPEVHALPMVEIKI